MAMSAKGCAIVTGGSKGIGLEICRQLVEDGYEVVVLGRQRPDRSGPRLQFLECDLLDEAALSGVAAELARRSDITHLVHNAGAVRAAPIDEAAPEDLKMLSQLHLGCAVTLVQAVLPAMKGSGFGRIVLVSSRGALGAPGRATYSATKAGMIGLARSLALELAPSGITVNVVAPGPIEGTDMFRSVVPHGSEKEASLARTIPVRRLGRTDDVARCVLFFADPRNGFLTGQTLYVCGGTSVGGAPI